jgi:hypothetical protein
LGSFTPAYLPQASPLWGALRWLHLDGVVGQTIGTAMTVLGVSVLVIAWLGLRPATEQGQRLTGAMARRVLVVWCLPFVIAPVVFSHDVYSYGAQGWMISHGQNPYDAGPGLLPGAFASYAPWAWRYTPAPYGPLALQIAHGVVNLSGGLPWLSAILMRIPAFMAVALIAWLLPKLAARLHKNVALVRWFACLNPLLVIDYIGGGHNDAWMMGLLVLGLWLASYRRGWPWAAAVIGLAASIKQPAILACVFLPWLIQPIDSWHDRLGRIRVIWQALVAAEIALAVFVLVSLVCGLGFGWISALSVPGESGSLSPAYLIGSILQGLISPGGTWWLSTMTTVMLLVGTVVVVSITLRLGPFDPLSALAWVMVVTAFAMAALHPWYLLWGGLLLPLARLSKRAWFGVGLVMWVVFGYMIIVMAVRNGWTGLAAGIIGLICCWAWLWRHFRVGATLSHCWRHKNCDASTRRGGLAMEEYDA